MALPVAHGMGLGPALFKIQNVPLGKPLDVKKSSGVSFFVDNDSAEEQVCVIKSARPSQAGLADWEQGYDEVPDVTWFRLDKESLNVPAKSKAEVGLTIEIPDKPEYYNCKWVLAVVLASGNKNGIGVGLAVAARVQIETLQSMDKNSGNGATLATVPGAIDITGRPGAAFKESVQLQNNSDKVLHCIPERLLQVYPDAYKHSRYTSGGFNAIIEETWLNTVVDPFTLKPGKKKDVSIRGKIPITAMPGERWEELVFIRADEEAKKNTVKPSEQRQVRTFFRIRFLIVSDDSK